MDAVLRRVLRAGDAVFLHTAAACPAALGAALSRVASDVGGLSTVSLHTEGAAPWLASPYISPRLLFVGANARGAVAEGRAAFVPTGLLDAHRAIERRSIRVDVALVSATPPGADGFMSLGPSCDITLAALRAARKRVVQVNARLPHLARDGGTLVHVSVFDEVVGADEDLPCTAPRANLAPSDATRVLAALVASIVPDGACLQLGIGATPDAVASALATDGHKDLGIHSEMIGSGVQALVASGAVNGSRKTSVPGRVVTSFAVGDQQFYTWLDCNPAVLFLETSEVNAEAAIAANPNVVAINSACQVSLSGEICAEEVDGRIISGSGGQLDFHKGAFASRGGVAVTALTSTTAHGASRIVTKAGGGVTTPRALADVVVTEFGVARLRGASLQERAARLAAIAHPFHRAALLDAHARGA